VKNFAIVGVAGYVAPRHLKAIKETGNRLVAATDPHDAVGILDSHSLEVRYFPEIERFDRHLDKLRRGAPENRVQYVSICSPNYLHDAHCRLALRDGADAICEKPLVINPWNLDPLRALEAETGRRIYTVLQLRAHPRLIALRDELAQQDAGQHAVCLSYVTARGKWYQASWKGATEKSGGVAVNIGIHFFDLLAWLFGAPGACRVHLAEPQRMAGWIEFQRARARWFLSTRPDDLPPAAAERRTFRSLTVDGREIEFSEGFTDLHTRVYADILAGRGVGIEEARGSIELTHQIRNTPVTEGGGDRHPYLT
jgi:UDP-N-acetyl-2-amino-2-deoxyglucuronate dehydrogenase